ncbi:MAG: tRNA (adenosine(37)-N6)-dimethylallyltransferase MiaA [bacterium]|nr:tRNA (adenosine(37)-N6)-dimethylallyltransferase MiaA [bacterium]
MINAKQKLVVILGPTASGKSELAVQLAKKYNGEIISADSRQVYRELDIGSGKVPRDSIFRRFNPLMEVEPLYIYKGIIHHLLDVASPKKTFTVAQYQKLAKKALKKIIKNGKIPIICGGTGLYIDALIYDYQFPKVPPQPKLRKQLEKKSAEDLFKQLKKLDPRRAKNIDKHNRRRLIRALEIILTTRKPIPSLTILCGRSSGKNSNFDILKIGITKSPEELKKMIKKRLLKRLKIGMIEEVKNLRFKKGLSWKRLDDLGLEYRYIARYLRGLINKKEMIKLILKESYRYTKRQMTWFKRDKNIIWIDNPKKAVAICRDWLGL